MELFSEIYGVYYKIVADILKQAPLSKDAIKKVVDQSGFGESVLHLLPKLLDQQAWPLLSEQDGQWKSKLTHPPLQPFTLLEKRWLKAILNDPRAQLFLQADDLERLEQGLLDVTPLFERGRFRYFDQDLDGDPYQDELYQKNFRSIIAALGGKVLLNISYQKGPGKSKKSSQGDFAPLKLSYSEKDDKFRLYCGRVQQGRLIDYSLINLSRIKEINPSQELYSGDYDLDSWLAKNRSTEPIVLEITPERNGIERFMVAFSLYEKQSILDEETGICTASIWYPKRDETEMLIKILGFGPVLQVLSPPHFVAQIRQRVQNQMRLNENGSGSCFM